MQVPWGNFTANGVLDLINQPGAFFDAGARAGAHVQAECSRVHRREEVLPQERNQKSGGSTKTEEQHHEYNAVSQDEPEQIPITLPKPIERLLELMLERDEGTEQAAQGVERRAWSVGASERVVHALPLHAPTLLAPLLKPHHQRRNERSGQRVRSEHREYYRLSQGREEVTRHASEKEHRNEDNANAQRGYQGGQSDFAGADQNPVFQCLTGT